MRFSISAALAGAALLAGCASAGGSEPASASAPPAKNIIFFLGDGLGINTMTAARIYAVGEDGNLVLDSLPESAFVKTFSRDAQVTDSAAAMSAYMTGVKVNNGVISMAADTASGRACVGGKPVPTLLEMAVRAGRATGVVTTTSVTDATPAATYAHGCHRRQYSAYAAAMVPGGAGYNGALGKGIDVVLGGGSEHFTPREAGGERTDGRDLLAEMGAAGYALADTPEKLAQLSAQQGGPAPRVLGLFSRTDLRFDAKRDPARQPSLEQMTTSAIDLLARAPNGFFLMVEGGLIDHALHANDARSALDETAAFDRAIGAAIARMRVLDPGLKNTLIVVTADHDHTLLLNGYAKRTGKTTATEPGVLGLVVNYFDGKLARDLDGAPYSIIGFGNGVDRQSGLRDPAAGGHQATLRSRSGSGTHGGTDVFLGAVGARAESFRGTLDNTRVFTLIKEAGAL